MLVSPEVVRKYFAVHLSRRTDYSFRLVILLGVDADRTVSIGDAAKRLDVSSHHLAKIAQDLAQTGIVETVRGRGGGVRLTPQGLETTVGDMVRGLEALALVECFDPEHNNCRLTPGCQLASILQAGMDAFLGTLDEYTVSDLCAKPTKLRRLLA